MQYCSTILHKININHGQEVYICKYTWIGHCLHVYTLWILMRCIPNYHSNIVYTLYVCVCTTSVDKLYAWLYATFTMIRKTHHYNALHVQFAKLTLYSSRTKALLYSPFLHKKTCFKAQYVRSQEELQSKTVLYMNVQYRHNANINYTCIYIVYTCIFCGWTDFCS